MFACLYIHSYKKNETAIPLNDEQRTRKIHVCGEIVQEHDGAVVLMQERKRIIY